jgi:FkbM family methyltransferase
LSKSALFHALSRLFPEGALKGRLRLWFYVLTGKINRHQVTRERLPFTIRYQLFQNRFRLCFDQGRWAGRELVLPAYYDATRHPDQITSPWAFVWYVGLEVESYFCGPELCEGDLVVDAGACPGDYSLLAGEAVGAQGRVVALEADRYSAGYLQGVVELNQGTNCDVRHMALACKGGEVSLLMDEHGTQLSDAAEAADTDTIPAISYDELIEDSDPAGQRRHVLKMDIEGAEADLVPAILSGVHTPDLWIIAAYHPDRETGEATHVRLQPMLEEAGYKCMIGEHDHTVLFAWHPDK